jgi:hypothetical protein
LSSPFDLEYTSALLGFTSESGLYCHGISDAVANGYATDYAKMLENRARGFETTLPRIPNGLFEPNRNLIRATLDRMCSKYFPAK